MQIDNLQTLRQLYIAPQGRAVKKQLAALDKHGLQFIALSPFAVLATSDAQHQLDASPRGGPPGFIKATADGALLIPDSPGNNRLESLENILATGQLGLLFMIPGVDETLRVNGSAVLSVAPDDIALCSDERRAPKLVIKLTVQAAYLHCAKAFMRSRLWSPAARVDRGALPTIGQMIGDQTGMVGLAETQAEMEQRYAPDL
jgi:PPOX class probable FMN-dependent enzyme